MIGDVQSDGVVWCGRLFVMQQGNDEASLADEIRNAEERLHIFNALGEALSDPHEVLQLLMDADDPDLAGEALREKYGFDLVQAQAVLDSQFRRVTKRDLRRVLHGRDELAEHLRRLASGTSDTKD